MFYFTLYHYSLVTNMFALRQYNIITQNFNCDIKYMQVTTISSVDKQNIQRHVLDILQLSRNETNKYYY